MKENKVKVIKIENEVDKKSFEKRIFLYRSVFFKNIKFALDDKTNSNQYESLINALNIKKRKKRIEYVYDTACNEIDKHNAEQKIDCEFIEGKCLNQHNTGKCNGCCRACPWQTDHGCPSRNLTCKLFFCDEIIKKYDVMTFKRLKILKALPLRSQLIIRDNFFIKRENFINTLYWNSICIYGIKLTINLFRLMAYNFKNRKRTNLQK